MILPKKAKDLTGQRYGKLLVIALDERWIRGEVTWICRCDCGKTTIATTAALRSGNKKSCGCLVRTPLQPQPVLSEVKSITISKPSLIARILELAKEAQCSHTVWVSTALEDWIVKHRSNRYGGDPTRYTARNEDHTTIYHE
jgi:hypothetical protein